MATQLDAKELQQIGRQIVKAADSGDPASTVLDLLKPLENFRATEDLLRQSKIGIAITKLRQNKDPKVAETASKLVNRWKQEVSQKKKKPGSDSPAPPSRNGTGASATGSPAPQVKSETKGEQRKSTVDPAKRNTTSDRIDFSVTGDKTRDGCLKLMYDGLAFMSEESPDAVFSVARKVEVAAFEHFRSETNNEYKQKMRSLFQNLKFKDNQLLRRDVFTQKIEPKKFVTMTSEELKSEDRRKEDEALEKENMSKAMTAQEAKAISTTMTCGRCKESKVSYSQAQTRSADEPLTTFCECTVCGHRWKFS
ncbi:hypothetical protein CERZMDRAFT_80623 [Cercospora zeae-maydis SCOH1-5]|uniref:Transcription elongation factor n=1 Tax=Cercospora zeae-maydis SCOH1-5 TaxID=717836 RepID=A0A6A6FX49_9PEZI|nr:hypothetical protein CERZMDRAFT_80623 [Cercospora zeae-maydis SCOH1-5]